MLPVQSLLCAERSRLPAVLRRRAGGSAAALAVRSWWMVAPYRHQHVYSIGNCWARAAARSAGRCPRTYRAASYPHRLFPLIFEAVAILSGGRLQLTPFKSYRARAHRWTSLLPTAFTLQLLGIRPSRGDVRSVLRCALFFVLASASVSVVVLLDVRRHRVYTSPWVQGLLIPLVGLVGTLRLLPILLVRPLTQPSPELATWKHRRLWGVWRAGLVVYGLWTMGVCIATYV